MKQRLISSSIVVAILATGMFFGFSSAERKKQDELYKQVELFADTLSLVEAEYVDETKPKDLIYGALKGMLASLDPHSQFMDPDTYNELKVDTEGKFGGIGIEITIKDGLLTVITPIDGTPAWRAGIKANDRIVKINNDLTRDMTLTDAVKKMRGKPQETVNLTILRESEKKLIEMKIVRDIIRIKDIKEAQILEDGIGYIRLVEFRENTAADLNTTLNNLTKSGMNALIIDLRNNPGGLLDVAVKVTEKFIENGKLVVYTQGRKKEQNLKFFAQSNKPLTDIPMVVLVNEGSASGSEIVAGALQDYKRAVIMGVKSFGKGSVQTVIPLSDGSALRLTTSKYFTPLGRMIHGNGVIPDIVVEAGTITPDKKPEDAGNEPTVENVFEKIEGKQGKELSVSEKFNYKTDSQIMRAVDVLKAARLFKK